jgi:hypothetical protein
MKRAQNNMDGGPVSEMAIVDTFTKLIFGEDSRYSNRELLIIQAFRMVDTNVVFDSHRDMGSYLRALGVDEMVQIVTRVQRQLSRADTLLPDAAALDSARDGAINRGIH